MRGSVLDVVQEATTAAILTALMILVFLGSWRSTLIVCTSIPLAILFSLSVLAALGYTINVMSLGGLALAVGILVDDATVEIENTHRNLGEGKKPLGAAILDSAEQVAVPALVSTMCICIVFVPVTFAVRGSEVPLHSIGTRRCPGSDCVLFAVADARSDHDALPSPRGGLAVSGRGGIANKPQLHLAISSEIRSSF